MLSHPTAQLRILGPVARHVAVAVELPVFHQCREHLLPSLIEWVPDETKFVQSPDSIRTQHPCSLRMTLCCDPVGKAGMLCHGDSTMAICLLIGGQGFVHRIPPRPKPRAPRELQFVQPPDSILTQSPFLFETTLHIDPAAKAGMLRAGDSTMAVFLLIGRQGFVHRIPPCLWRPLAPREPQVIQSPDSLRTQRPFLLGMTLLL